jgi:hypothetical protein
MGENLASSHLAQGWQGTCSLIGSFEKDWIFYPYSFPRSPTAMDERVVKIPSHMIPNWKLKWSAIKPKSKGPPPFPIIIPMETATPTAIERSERGVRFESAAKPAGKKPTERVA